MRSVAIDIGDYSIKVVELESKGVSGYTVCDSIEVPKVGNTSDNLSITEETIKKVARHYQGQSVKFVFGIKQENLRMQYHSFPIKERNQIVKSLPFQLADEVPFNANNVSFEAKFLGSLGNSTEILSVICYKDHIFDLIALARECGIEPDLITSPSIGISNFISDWRKPVPSLTEPLYSDSAYQGEGLSTNAEVVIDIGHKTTDLSIYINQFIVQNSTLYFGGIDIVKALAKTYEITVSEAYKHLEEKGFVLTSDEKASKNQIFFSNSIKDVLKSGLIRPLNQIFLAISSQKQISFSKIHLMVVSAD